MKSDIQISFRKMGDGPEANLVKNFLTEAKDIFCQGDYEYTIWTEPYAEIGVPDVLIIEWDKKGLEKWSPERKRLTKDDIKCIHHISTFGKKGVKISQLSHQLGYSQNRIKKITQKLLEADLIFTMTDRAFLFNPEENFFIKRIITVEAKIKNWKEALHQAELNENFASHSYILLPHSFLGHERVTKSIKSNIGLLVQDKNRVILKKRARKGRFPGSYFSWMINEYLGQKHLSNNLEEAYV